jgi:hypothetical protein
MSEAHNAPQYDEVRFGSLKDLVFHVVELSKRKYEQRTRDIVAKQLADPIGHMRDVIRPMIEASLRGKTSCPFTAFFVSSSGMFVPVVVGDMPNSAYLKDALAGALILAGSMSNTDLIYLVMEAWTATSTPEALKADPNFLPSEQPDRREVVVMTCETQTVRKLTMFDIIRDTEGNIAALVPDKDDELRENCTGRFSNLLRDIDLPEYSPEDTARTNN